MIKIWYVYQLMLSGIFHNVNTECPPGWLHHGESCYFFGDDIFPWDIAQDLCKEYHGYLAEVDTRSENDYLEDFARRNQKSYWLGGKDDRSEGQWYWVNSNHPFQITDWSPGQPDNAGNEDCLHLWAGVAYHWNDFPCAYEQNYICETSFTSSSP